ncbi:MAG TPA: hypothetical protein VLD62_02475 [Acidimicrobiia bacterium]|nr:hypothetical protein [Acidimicrobiia bacterium]
MGRFDHVNAVFYRTASLLKLDVREPEAFGPLQLRGRRDGFAVSITGRSGGVIPGSYRNRFLVILDPEGSRRLPAGFRAEPWTRWHGWRRWAAEPAIEPVVAITAKSGLETWLDGDRRAALRDAVAIAGFSAADGLFGAERSGIPQTPADLIDPLESLISIARRLVA